MNDEEFRDGEFRGKILSELEALKAGQLSMTSALNDFKEKIGERMVETEKSVTRLDGEMSIILTIGKWIFAPVFMVMGVGVLGIIGWYFSHK